MTSRPEALRRQSLAALAALLAGAAMAALSYLADPWLSPFGGQGFFYVLGLALMRCAPLLLLGALQQRFYPGLWAHEGWPRLAALLALGAAAAFLLPGFASRLVNGQRYWLLSDDQMVSMCYAKNLAEGHGLTWNGARIQGFSNPLWTLAMALPLWLGAAPRIAPLLMSLAGLGFAFLCALELDRLAVRLGFGTLKRAVLAASFALCTHTAMMAIDAMEMLPLAWLGLRCIRMTVFDADAQWKIGLQFALIALLRADGLAWAGIFMLPMLAKAGRRMAALRLLSWPLAATLLCLLAQKLYYGEWVANTVILKTTNWPGKLAAGLGYVAGFARCHAYALSLAAFALAFSRLKERWLLGLPLLANIACVAWQGGDFEFFFRFLFPTLPLMLLLAFSAASESAAATAMQAALFLVFAYADGRQSADLLYPVQSGHAHNLGLLAPLLLACLLAGFAALPGERAKAWGLGSLLMLAISLPLFPMRLPEFRSLRNSERLDAALAMQSIAVPGAKVADAYAGLFFYYSGLPGIDLLGKCDATVARLQARAGQQLPGHIKFDLDYSFGALKPRYVINRSPQLLAALDKDPDFKRRRALGEPLGFEESAAIHPYFTHNCRGKPVWLGSASAVYDCGPSVH